MTSFSYFGNISVKISPNNKKNDSFEIYTERAVEKCPRWNFFANFAQYFNTDGISIIQQ